MATKRRKTRKVKFVFTKARRLAAKRNIKKAQKAAARANRGRGKRRTTKRRR